MSRRVVMSCDGAFAKLPTAYGALRQEIEDLVEASKAKSSTQNPGVMWKEARR